MKMKKIFILIIIVLIGFPIVSNLHAQQNESLRERLARRQQAQQSGNTANRNLTLRAQLMNDAQTEDISNASWMREIYRELDLEKDVNAALYYPVKPFGNRMNLATMIFNKVVSGEITAYKFIQGATERLTEDNILKVDSAFFYGLDVPFEIIDGKYVVDPDFVPSEEVRKYYIKEVWYFDKNNSVVGIQTTALCPIMEFQGYDTGMERYPLFWVSYESIRPYTSQMPIMVSSLNNAVTQTINDFFVKRNFDGEIYKTTNTRNLSLQEQYQHPDSLKNARNKIEQQLIDFRDNLWVYNDSIDFTQQDREARRERASGNSGSNSEIRNQRSGQQKSSAVRTMRNRKRN